VPSTRWPDSSKGRRVNGARTLRCPGPVAVPANDTVAGRTTPSTPSSSRPCGAKEWIAGYLSAHGSEAVAAEVIEAGLRLGFPASTLKNARPKVADTVRIGFGRAQKTYWRLRAGLGTTAGAPPARTPSLTDTADPAMATEPAGPAAALGPSDTATPQPARATRPPRVRRRLCGTPAPGQGTQQPTLFAVMGVSEP
jgi:hypothetical protein